MTTTTATVTLPRSAKALSYEVIAHAITDGADPDQVFAAIDTAYDAGRITTRESRELSRRLSPWD